MNLIKTAMWALFSLLALSVAVNADFIISGTNVTITTVYTNSTNGYVYDDSLDLSAGFVGAETQSVPTKNITNWFLNNKSIQLLNMPFEGGSNTTFTKDYSGFNNNATLVGVTWNATGGYDGFGAYHFDGTNGNRINQTPNNPLFDFNETTPFTITAWAKLDAFSASILTVFDKMAANSGYRLVMTTTNFNFQTRNTTNDIVSSTFGDDPVVGQWYFVTGVFNGTHQMLYVDGILRDADLIGNNIGVNSVVPFNIGYTSNNALSFNGTIDDVIVWNRSLTSEQIYAIYVNQTSTIVGKETKVGDQWMACVATVNSTTNSSRVCSQSVTILDNTTESGARTAIDVGINNQLSGATIFSDHIIHTRLFNGTQQRAVFDRAVTYGNNTWAFNFIANGDLNSNMYNITPVFYVSELNGSAQLVQAVVERLISTTRQ